jgi:PleD family two-component response regulator
VIIVAGGAEQQARVLAAGAEAYLPKPIEREAFLQRVRTVLEQARRG